MNKECGFFGIFTKMKYTTSRSYLTLIYFINPHLIAAYAVALIESLPQDICSLPHSTDLNGQLSYKHPFTDIHAHHKSILN